MPVGRESPSGRNWQGRGPPDLVEVRRDGVSRQAAGGQRGSQRSQVLGLGAPGAWSRLRCPLLQPGADRIGHRCPQPVVSPAGVRYPLAGGPQRVAGLTPHLCPECRINCGGRGIRPRHDPPQRPSADSVARGCRPDRPRRAAGFEARHAPPGQTMRRRCGGARSGTGASWRAGKLGRLARIQSGPAAVRTSQPAALLLVLAPAIQRPAADSGRGWARGAAAEDNRRGEAQSLAFQGRAAVPHGGGLGPGRRGEKGAGATDAAGRRAVRRGASPGRGRPLPPPPPPPGGLCPGGLCCGGEALPPGGPCGHEGNIVGCHRAGRFTCQPARPRNGREGRSLANCQPARMPASRSGARLQFSACSLAGTGAEPRCDASDRDPQPGGRGAAQPSPHRRAHAQACRGGQRAHPPTLRQHVHLRAPPPPDGEGARCALWGCAVRVPCVCAVCWGPVPPQGQMRCLSGSPSAIRGGVARGEERRAGGNAAKRGWATGHGGTGCGSGWAGAGGRGRDTRGGVRVAWDVGARQRAACG